MKDGASSAIFGAEIIDRWTLPWPEIRVPSYRLGRVGSWELKRQFQPVLRGYFRGLQVAKENYLLTRGDRVWMSLSPVEIESLAPHISYMRGHVVIAGLGMGLALYNSLLHPAVRRITVLEHDPDVIALFDTIRGPDWPSPDRFAIEIADAREWRHVGTGRLSSMPTSGTKLAPPKRPPIHARFAETCGRNLLVIGAWRRTLSPFSPATGANRR